VQVPMSNFSEEGVSAVKAAACERLLEQRVERKLKGARAHDGGGCCLFVVVVVVVVVVCLFVWLVVVC
jgi:hypothetical protein